MTTYQPQKLQIALNLTESPHIIMSSQSKKFEYMYNNEWISF